MGSITMHFDTQPLEKNLQAFDDKVRRIITGQFLYAETDAVLYAKEEAPWHDRSGAARAGLHAATSVSHNHWELTVAHSEHYGIWLETRFSGKYAIIMKTVRNTGKLLMYRLERSLGRLQGISTSRKGLIGGTNTAIQAASDAYRDYKGGE